MELSHFAPTYVENETLKMNQIDSELNHKQKVAVSICIYNSYHEMYDTTINVKWAHSESDVSFNKQADRRKGKYRITETNNPAQEAHQDGPQDSR